MKSNKNTNKIINSFYLVGIEEVKIKKYKNDEKPLRFIEKMDILNTNLNIKNTRYDLSNQKWLRILNTSHFWLRFQYSDNYENPITNIRIYECDYYSKDYLLLSMNLYNNGYRPIKSINYESSSNDIKDFPKIAQEESFFPKLDSKYVLIPSEYNSKNSLNLPTPKKAALLLICRKTIYLPLKEVIFQKKPGQTTYQFGILRHKSPYSYKYMPEVLDSYPMKEKLNQSIGLFCFPEGIQINDRFITPKCFNFVLTDEFGERTYGSSFVFVQEITIRLREAFVPTYEPNDKTFYCPKAICILSKYPFYYNCLLFLKEIYNIIQPKSSFKIPIERAICSFVDSLYIQTYDKLLRFKINDKNLDFYRIANYGKIWDTNDNYLDTLFRLLSYEQIIASWKGLLLEKKLYLICSSKMVLSHISHALINLLFPFKWIHVYVPILPEKLKLFIESPVPLIIGISFNIEKNELPNDSLILNINNNCFEKYNEKMPPLPSKLKKILMNKLNKLKEEYNLDNPQHTEKIISNLEEANIYLDPDNSLYPKIDTYEIRDAFYNVFIAMFKNYEKYFSWNKQSINLIGTESHFLKENFLKDFNSLEENSFLYLFTETSLFRQIVDSFRLEEKNIKSSFAFFLESIKRGKGKNKYFLQNVIPNNVVFAPEIIISDLNNKTFNYPEFSKLDSSLFIKHEAPDIPYKSKFVYLKDEWCYSTEKFKKKDWERYFLYLIYDIWFTFFSFVLNIYEDNQAIIMMDYALSLLEYLWKTLKISPTRNLFSKLIKSCARKSLNPFIKQMLILLKNINKGQSKYSTLFHNDYLNGLYFLSENVGQNIGAPLTNSNLLTNTFRSTIVLEIKKNDINIESKLNKIIFIPYNLCENCMVTKGITKCLTFDEILAGFIMRKNDDNTSICSNCLNRYEPKLFLLDNNQKNLNLKEINFVTPMKLIKRIDEIIKEKGEIYFYKNNEWNEVYLNIVFYFQLFDLPTCILYVQNDMEKFEKIKNILKQNKIRKYHQEKKASKKSFFFSKLNIAKDNDTSDLSLNNSKYENNINSKISDISINTEKKYTFNLDIEMEIWKNYHLQKQNQIKEINELNKNLSNEDKNEVNLRVKEFKEFFNDIIKYFNIQAQEKLKQFMDNYDKIESMKQYDYANMKFNENEEFDRNEKIKQNQSQIQNKNSFKQKKNSNSNIQISNEDKDGKCSTNIHYNLINKQKQKTDYNEMRKETKKDENNEIPLDNIRDVNNNIQLLENNIMNNNNNNAEINNKSKMIKINYNNNDNINNIKNTNKIKIIHSPNRIINKQIIYLNNNKRTNSSKANKIKSFKILDSNIKNNLFIQSDGNINNNIFSFKEGYNQTNNKFYSNKGILPKNTNNINFYYVNPQNYENKRITYQSNNNNILNKRYDPKDNYNIGILKESNNNIKEIKNIPNYQQNIQNQLINQQNQNYINKTFK